MRTIKINEKENDYFVEIYFDDKVICAKKTKDRPEITVKKKNIEYKGYIDINGVILYFDKLELDTISGNIIVE